MGTAVRITPKGVLTVLHTFSGAPDGAFPSGGLMLASDGNFYGASEGGPYSTNAYLFRMSMSGEITPVSGLNDGTNPGGQLPQASPIEGGDGYLYGTTSAGGAANGGTVYRVALDGTNFTTIHNFGGLEVGDGADPIASLLLASDGNFYGVTYGGGEHQNIDGGDGVLFQITPSGDYAILYQFGASSRDGDLPVGGLVEVDGVLWGSTAFGGASGIGTVFKYLLP